MGGAYNDRKFSRIVRWWRWFALALEEQVTCPTLTSNRCPPPSSANALVLSGDATPHCASAVLCVSRRVPRDSPVATTASEPLCQRRVVELTQGGCFGGGAYTAPLTQQLCQRALCTAGFQVSRADAPSSACGCQCMLLACIVFQKCGVQCVTVTTSQQR